MATHLPIVVRTVSDMADPSDFEVVGASIPEARLAALIARDRFVDAVNQDGVRLQLSFDMDTESLVCERSEPEAATLVDRVTGARVALARYATFDITFAHQDSGESRAAYDDLIGPNIAAVMARVGWRYDGAMLRLNALSATTGPQIVGSSWAGTIRSRDGARGVNVSYGVGVSHRGAGLSRLPRLLRRGGMRSPPGARGRAAPNVREHPGARDERRVPERGPVTWCTGLPGGGLHRA
ncbi:hypothetical protein [Variovorax sp. LjRoot178]|uniref:hypothetical protein n=1 Tax=Variovorax sp. LjRoot178 TaxID=3342277 RepID=UPI003ECE0BD6